jgi:ribonuclease HII
MTLSWAYEDDALGRGFSFVAGIDEAGRGCLAGPVVAGAVIFLNRKACPEGLNDSKQLTRSKRQKLYSQITACSEILWSVGQASVEEIDRFNILNASHLAMERARSALSQPPDHLLIDGLKVKRLGDEQTPIVKGDALSFSIAAASIIAKETRDCLMEELDAQYPHYGLARHKGYSTQDHITAINRHGPCPHHRRSFEPVRQMSLDF